MKGRNLVKHTSVYYAMYENVKGLKVSDPVMINGFRVGIIDYIKFTPDKSGKLIVKFSIEEDIPFARNSTADIYGVDFMGSQAIRIIFGDLEDFAKSGDTLTGTVGGSISDLISEQILPLKTKTENLIDSLDSLLMGLNEMLNPEFRKNLNELTANLKSSSYTLDTLLTNKNGNFNSILGNVNGLTAKLNHSMTDLSNILENFSSVSDSLANSNIKGLINNLDQSLYQTQVLLKNMNEGTGTMGQLMTNDSLYIYLEHLTRDLDLLMIDMKENPGKYVHISVFGGNKKKKE
jgi:phospholipid/cholesterol/gamma-HCH transport system substrate-binding protein